MENETLPSLIQRAREGDPQAMEQVLLKAHTACFIGWVNRIAANLCIDHRRQAPRELQFLEDEEGRSLLDQLEDTDLRDLPDEVVDSAETSRMLTALVDALPAKQREVVYLYYFDQLQVLEIARLLEEPESTIKSRLNYARKAIKAGVLDYEKQGVKLYGVSPLPLLLLFLRREMEAGADAAAALAVAGAVAVGGLALSRSGRPAPAETPAPIPVEAPAPTAAPAPAELPFTVRRTTVDLGRADVTICLETPLFNDPGGLCAGVDRVFDDLHRSYADRTDPNVSFLVSRLGELPVPMTLIETYTVRSQDRESVSLDRHFRWDCDQPSWATTSLGSDSLPDYPLVLDKATGVPLGVDLALLDQDLDADLTARCGTADMAALAQQPAYGSKAMVFRRPQFGLLAMQTAQ